MSRWCVGGGCVGVVLRGFGSGNVPDTGPLDWRPLIELASSRGIPVLLTSPLPGQATDGGGYGPGCAARTAGAIGVGPMGVACAEVKFRWAIAQALAEGVAEPRRVARVRQLMAAEVVGEFGATSRS